MFLDHIYLTHFRNYSKQELYFDPGMNIFEGANAQGKTNLLEAIYYLAVSRSFRTNYEQELVHWGDNYFFLKGTFNEKQSFTTVEIGYQGNSKKFQIKVNGMAIKRSDFVYKFPIVVFSPDDLLLIKEGPSGRRRFLNLEGSRLKPFYYKKLKDYHRALQQRNKLLKETRFKTFSPELFEPWDNALVTLGSSIIKQRISLLQALEQQSQKFFQQLTGSHETLTLQYLSSVDIGKNPESVEAAFWDQLQSGRGEEKRRGYTVTGPHLDDFSIQVNHYDAKRFASQGQQRTAALALKMGEVELFYLSKRESPVILLDDVFSEFDLERRRQLLNFLLQREGQSFITTAVPFEQQSLKTEAVKIFSVHKGKISHEGDRSDY